MHNMMPNEMAEALRLTRAGRLAEATVVIQRSLAGPPARTTPSDNPANPVEPIEGTFRVVGQQLAPAGTPKPAPAEQAEPDTTPEQGRPELAPGSHTTGSPPGSGLDASRRSSIVASRLSEMTVSIRRALEAALPGGTAAPIIQPDTYSSGVFPRPGVVPAPAASGPLRAPAPARTVAQPSQRFIGGSYTNSAGSRTYRLYVPSGYAGQPVPLVVMLHGCTQTAADCATGTCLNALAEEETFLVVYPEQAAAANGSQCWNWFKRSNQQRGKGEPSLIAGITRQVMTAYCVDPRRVYVAGMSAGGAMAAIMGATYPDLYAAVGVHSGLAHGAARDLKSALTAMRQGAPAQAGPGDLHAAGSLPMIVFHGDCDTTVHPRNGEQVLAQVLPRPAGDAQGSANAADPLVSVSRGQVPGGHAYTRSVYCDAGGHIVGERWVVHGAGHAWSGGSPAGSFTDPRGPDASKAMLRFFREHPRAEPASQPAD